MIDHGKPGKPMAIYDDKNFKFSKLRNKVVDRDREIMERREEKADEKAYVSLPQENAHQSNMCGTRPCVGSLLLKKFYSLCDWHLVFKIKMNYGEKAYMSLPQENAHQSQLAFARKI